jgi:hypothetical protein
MKRLLYLAVLTALAACTTTGAIDTARVTRDVKIACDGWKATKTVAVIAGIFVPGVSSAAVIIGDFVDPVCDGSATAALTDPATVDWVNANVEKLRVLMNQPKQVAMR